MVYFLYALFAAIVAFAFMRKVLPTIVNFVVFGLICFLAMPTFAWGFYGGLFCIVLPIAAGYAWGIGYAAFNDFNITDSKARELKLGGIGTAAVAVVFLALVPMFTSWSAFHASNYRELLPVEERDFDTEQVLLDQAQARFVDQALAKRAAEELLGNNLGLGSRCVIGEMNIQSVNGRLWWVGPLEHRDFFKWASNGTTPGYMMVSANNYSDSKIVQDYELSIGMGGSFSGYLPRYLYQNGYATVGLTDYTFELDDSGKPYWVVTIQKPQVGFSGLVAKGVLVVDPTNGTIAEYSIDDAPTWIDRIQPQNITDGRIDDWGDFVHGWWNSWLAQRDVINASEGTSLVYTADGRCAWYTGLQSAGGSDQGTMGFMLVDARTGQAKFYRRAGITEAAARDVIKGQAQEKGYDSTWPIPYLVNGVPTFISVLKDDSGNPQMVGMVAYNDRTLVVVGESLRECLRLYSSKLRSQGTSLAIDGKVTAVSFEGTITRIGEETIGSETMFYIMIDTVDSKVFSIPSHLSQEILITRRGDNVKVTALDTGNAVVDVESFDNLDIKLSKTEDQKTLDARYQEALKRRAERKGRFSTDALLRSIDSETLQRLLEAIRKQEEKK